MEDKIRESFLRDSRDRAHALAESTSVLSILAEDGVPPNRYLCGLQDIEHLVKDGSGTVCHSTDPIVFQIQIPPDYLHCVDEHLGLKVVGMMTPIFHPNIANHAVCLGEAFRPGTPVDEIVRMVYEVVAFQNVTPDERNAFSAEACRYVREHAEELKHLQIPPLKRRKFRAKATVVQAYRTRRHAL